jgi:Rieske Fe-S protein
MFQLNTPVLGADAANNPFFVVRDAGGLFALTAICTHQGCTVGSPGTNMGFFCPCHCATFNQNGTNTSSPTASLLQPLVHFALSLMSGQVCVDTTTVVAATVRLNA